MSDLEDVKIMPHSMEAEAGVLSAILGCGSEVMDKVCPALKSNYFWDQRHKTIFKSALDLWKSSKPIDAQMVLNHLTDSKSLDLAGGDLYVLKLNSGFPSDAHVRHYVQEIVSKNRLRNLLDLGSEIMRGAWNSDSPDEYIQKIEREFYNIVEERQDQNLLESSHSEVMDLLSKLKSGEGLGAIKTGISAIDESIMGVVPGMFDVYAAEAGCGKTSLVEMIALRMLLEERPVLIFQRDMTPAGFYFRLACRMAGVTVSEIRKYYQRMKPEIEQVEKWALKLSKTPLKLYSPDGCTGADVRSIARRESRKSGIKVVIVDHIRTLRHTKKTSWDGLEESSGYIRQSTNETGIPHIVLAHINREGAKSERPTISNIKGGDQLKDDSDNCCVMWASEGKVDSIIPPENKKISFAFDKCRWDWSSVHTMNYNGPKMRFETIRD